MRWPRSACVDAHKQHRALHASPETNALRKRLRRMASHSERGRRDRESRVRNAWKLFKIMNCLFLANSNAIQKVELIFEQRSVPRLKQEFSSIDIWVGKYIPSANIPSKFDGNG